jgi:hypothetical protein
MVLFACFFSPTIQKSPSPWTFLRALLMSDAEQSAAAAAAAAAAPAWHGLHLCPQTHAPLVAWLAKHSHAEATHALRMGIDLYEMQRAQLVQTLVTREIQGQAAQLFQGALLDETQLRLQAQLAPVAGKLDQLQSTLGQMHSNLQVSSLKGAVGENLVRGEHTLVARSFPPHISALRA